MANRVIERVITSIKIIEALKRRKQLPPIQAEIEKETRTINHLMESYPDVRAIRDYFLSNQSENPSEVASGSTTVELPEVGSALKTDAVHGLVEGNYTKLTLFKKDGTLSKQTQYVKIGE